MKNEIKNITYSKYRRKVIYKELIGDIGQIIRKLGKEKKVVIIEAKVCPDYIYMLVGILLYLSVDSL